MTDFDALYRRYAPQVYRFALSLFGNRDAAEDITAETFTRVWTARDRVDLATVLGYLLTIARRLHLQGVTQGKRRGELDADPVDSGAAAPAAVVQHEAGRRTIARTQALLRRRSWLLAMGIFFTLLPFSFVYGDRGLRFLFLRDAPWPSAVSFATGAISWILFAATTRRLRVKGL